MVFRGLIVASYCIIVAFPAGDGEFGHDFPFWPHLRRDIHDTNDSIHNWCVFGCCSATEGGPSPLLVSGSFSEQHVSDIEDVAAEVRINVNESCDLSAVL